jgi:ketosteroid isomerase-like protein
MSQENVEIVQRGFMALVEDDWPTALATLHPNIEVRDFDIPDAGVYQGHEGFRKWLSNWDEGRDEWRPDNIEFLAGGSNDRVIALFKVIARGKGSGIEIERDDAIVYRLDAGRIIRMEYFNRRDAALEAAGLAE